MNYELYNEDKLVLNKLFYGLMNSSALELSPSASRNAFMRHVQDSLQQRPIPGGLIKEISSFSGFHGLSKKDKDFIFQGYRMSREDFDIDSLERGFNREPVDWGVVLAVLLRDAESPQQTMEGIALIKKELAGVKVNMREHGMLSPEIDQRIKDAYKVLSKKEKQMAKDLGVSTYKSWERNAIHSPTMEMGGLYGNSSKKKDKK